MNIELAIFCVKECIKNIVMLFFPKCLYLCIYQFITKISQVMPEKYTFCRFLWNFLLEGHLYYLLQYQPNGILDLPLYFWTPNNVLWIKSNNFKLNFFLYPFSMQFSFKHNRQLLYIIIISHVATYHKICENYKENEQMLWNKIVLFFNVTYSN